MTAGGRGNWEEETVLGKGWRSERRMEGGKRKIINMMDTKRLLSHRPVTLRLLADKYLQSLIQYVLTLGRR